MGHIRLGRLPRTKAWQAVIGELALPSATAKTVAQRVFAATSVYLLRDAVQEEGCYRPLLDLSQLAVAARDPKTFWAFLRSLGAENAASMEGAELLRTIVSSRPGRRVKGGETETALSDIADQAYRETVLTSVWDKSETLWGATPDDVRLAFKGFGGKQGYSELVRGWFGRFVGRSLLYFLDRELANHVGSKGPVSTSSSAVDLERSVLSYAHERTQILRDFAPGWLSKTLWEKKGLSLASVRGFFRYCVKKIAEDVKLETHE